MRPTQLFAAVMAMSSVSVAMSDAFDNIHGLADVKNVLFGRQDDNSDNASSEAPQSTQPPESSRRPTASQSNSDEEPTSSGRRQSGSVTVSGSGGSKTTSPPKSKSYDPRVPAGGISMVTPDPFAGQQFYKVGDWVTFAWNYTGVSVTPTAIDVLASCTANQATYTIAVNMSAEETKVLWDTKNTPEGQAPFLTNEYMLLIYDSDTSVTAAPRPGYLAAYSAHKFGMYTPMPYTPFADYTCANCNGAMSHFEKMTIKALLFTTGTTIGSLLYFTYTFGLW